MKKYSKPQLTVVSFKFENGYQASNRGVEGLVNMATSRDGDTDFNENTQQQNWTRHDGNLGGNSWSW